ncbi:uncharacterized protein LOC106655595 [Trichogramma pretiosum]|uniref:uncharacterized protein LOC106655595 n=1 Tax=Trichogramma pretiosum TaxID=7493 RepID=UPI0006C959E7|nr:uncharacterized protein LOC106655595 [Trichogramma pretiosum]
MMNADSDLEDDEEEILVYVEFDNCISSDVFSKEDLKLDMLGLDSEHPVMQINGKFFEGTYEDAVGTYLFFENDLEPKVDDPVFDKVPRYRYYNKTRKVLKMQRAFLIPRNEVVGDSEHPECVPNLETLKEAGVPPKYQDQALDFWGDARISRVQALNDYMKKQQHRHEMRMKGFELESESDDDSPFSIYKSNYEQQLENGTGNVQDLESQVQNLENVLQNTDIEEESSMQYSTNSRQNLTVLDPGPSTSKDSIPWNDENITEKSMPSKKVKTVGKVKDTSNKKTKPKRVKKVLDLNEIEGYSEYQARVAAGIQNDPEKITGDIENGNSEELMQRKFLESIKTEEMEVEEENAELSELALAKELKMTPELMMARNKTKREKREAKMKEIREKNANARQSKS